MSQDIVIDFRIMIIALKRKKLFKKYYEAGNVLITPLLSHPILKRPSVL